MKKILSIIVLFLILNTHSLANDLVLASLQDGKKLIFIRHAIAPGNGDPENFDIMDCNTQRNLDEKGIQQSKKIGLYFKKNKIKIDKVLSSQWCRCKDTAKIAFKKFKTFNALNSFYDEKFAANELNQIEDLKKYIKKCGIKLE